MMLHTDIECPIVKVVCFQREKKRVFVSFEAFFRMSCTRVVKQMMLLFWIAKAGTAQIS